jgi:hypothetical protein
MKRDGITVEIDKTKVGRFKSQVMPYFLIPQGIYMHIYVTRVLSGVFTLPRYWSGPYIKDIFFKIFFIIVVLGVYCDICKSSYNIS